MVNILGKIIAVANQKGGVGKTTTAVNLSAGLALLGRRVLLIDCDPQGNATSGLGIDKNTLEQSVYDVLVGQANLGDIIIHTDFDLDLVPSVMDLAGAEVELVEAEDKLYRLQKAITPIRGIYIEGLVMTMFDSRTNLSQQVEAEVRNHFPNQVYETKIPRTVRLSEAPSYGQPIFAYAATSKGALAYEALAKEVADHE